MLGDVPYYAIINGVTTEVESHIRVFDVKIQMERISEQSVMTVGLLGI